jgi:integrase/recombinase XerD
MIYHHLYTLRLLFIYLEQTGLVAASPMSGLAFPQPQHGPRAILSPGAREYGYARILDYIGECRSKYPNPGTVNRILASVKVYYDWLCHSGQRRDHLAGPIRLRDNRHRDVQLQDLFKPEELEGLLERKNRYADLLIRNQVVISLLIYQGLSIREMGGLRLVDVQLTEGSVYVHGTPKTNGRTLPLRPRQIMLLHGYITQERPCLLKEKTDALILTKLGTAERGEGIHYLVSTYQDLFPDRSLTAQTIRQSVITNLLNKAMTCRWCKSLPGINTRAPRSDTGRARSRS